MAEIDAAHRDEPAEPPGGGRQDHEVMRVAATLPVSGPASTDTLAASSGLLIPGNERQAIDASTVTDAHVPEPIPGERDPSTLTHPWPGAGPSPDAYIPSPDARWLGDATACDRKKEGGGQCD